MLFCLETQCFGSTVLRLTQTGILYKYVPVRTMRLNGFADTIKTA